MPVDTSALQQALIEAAPEIVAEAADLMRNDIDLSAPVDTGALVQSSQVDTQANPQGATATLRYTEEYAGFLDTGTGPHAITGNPYLAFQIGGQTVIVHSVEHPGSHKWDGWFTDKAGDESLWATQVQAAISGAAIF